MRRRRLQRILAKALQMGDDGHNRLDAASVLWTSQLAPYIAKTARTAPWPLRSSSRWAKTP